MTQAEKNALGVQAVLQMAGGASAVSRILGVSHVTVVNWSRVPVDHVPKLAAALGLPRYLLRSDVYERPSLEQAA
ncbi:MAG: hypothetical protein AAFY06_00070 [Pseudomonadota bacterium]